MEGKEGERVRQGVPPCPTFTDFVRAVSAHILLPLPFRRYRSAARKYLHVPIHRLYNIHPDTSQPEYLDPDSVIKSDLMPAIAGCAAGRDIDAVCLEQLKTSVHSFPSVKFIIFTVQHQNITERRPLQNQFLYSVTV